MSMNDLKDIYIDQLQDIYSADRQSLNVTKELADKASDGELTDALSSGVKGIEDGMAMLKTLIEGHDADPTGEHCKGMEGLVREAQAHALQQDFGNDEARDAMIITQYQRMVHYAIAGYGCLVAFAKRLGLEEEALKLQAALDATYDGDKHMTRMATSGINSAAV